MKLKPYLAKQIQKNIHKIWDWNLSYNKLAPPPFYCSVDLRDSEYKIAPVDCNLYPAGFNNICPEDLRLAPALLRTQIEAICLRGNFELPRKILILPESHTSNSYYIENIYTLNLILTQAGFETTLGWYYSPTTQDESVQEMHHGTECDEILLTSFTQKELKAHPIQIKERVLSAGGFVPDMILLNNDFSSGYPKILDSIQQPILPSHILGWHSRKKSSHFKYYNQLAKEFATLIDIDPWHIQIETQEVGPVNFNEEKGVDQVATATKKVLEGLNQAYREHQVEQKPFVYVKNNQGTYGMGIIVIHSEEELSKLNRRSKNKMSVGKNHLPIESVIVQEGIPTNTIINRVTAEPVIYLFGSELVGGFLRTNEKKNREENLNSQGMVFKKLCMSDLKCLSQIGDTCETLSNEKERIPVLELVYGSIARISALATGLELKEKS